MATIDDVWHEYYEVMAGANDDLTLDQTKERLGRLLNVIDLFQQGGIVTEQEIQNTRITERVNFHQVHGYLQS